MSAITWIIIILIIVSILVTVTEVVLRFAMLRRDGATDVSPAIAGSSTGTVIVPPAPPLLLNGGVDEDPSDAGLSDLEVLARALGLQNNASLGDVKKGIWELRRQEEARATELVDEPRDGQELEV